MVSAQMSSPSICSHTIEQASRQHVLRARASVAIKKL
jgi:hypothetical protein